MPGLDNWNDAVTVLPGYFVESFDSLFYNLFDELAVSLGNQGTGVGSDQLVLTDGLTLQLSGAIGIGDFFSFADSFDKQLLSTNHFTDSMNLSDLLGLQLNIGLIFSDSGSMTDGSGTATNDQLLVMAADTLNAWADSVDTLSSTSETTYLRQYLNDVVN